MATAVQPSPVAQWSPRVRLALASLFGALFVLGGLVVAAYLVPEAWNAVVGPRITAVFGTFLNVALRLLVQAAALAGVVWLGTRLAGASPPKGVRGGIFLALVALVATLFVTRSVGLTFEGTGFGLPLTLVVLAGLLYGTYFLLTVPRVQGVMLAVEEQGWFHAFSYKRSQGLRARRYSLIGFLLIGWTGVYSLYIHTSLGTGPWRVAIPFTGVGPDRLWVTLLPDVEFAVPLILAVLAFWVAWRAVNMPVFADFLIATEAEMNKVSWPTRRGLIQDTVVVLATTLILTLFLLVVDWFWGTLLSAVQVLPKTSDQPGGAQVKTLDW